MFDPYRQWLGIPKGRRPPTEYELLGVAPGERDAAVIREAALRQTARLRPHQIGAHARECTELLNEVARAVTSLLRAAGRDEPVARPRGPGPFVRRHDSPALAAPALGVDLAAWPDSSEPEEARPQPPPLPPPEEWPTASGWPGPCGAVDATPGAAPADPFADLLPAGPGPRRRRRGHLLTRRDCFAALLGAAAALLGQAAGRALPPLLRDLRRALPAADPGGTGPTAAGRSR